MNRARKQAGHNAQGNVELFSQLQRPACLRARFMNSEAGLGITFSRFVILSVGSLWEVGTNAVEESMT